MRWTLGIARSVRSWAGSLLAPLGKGRRRKQPARKPRSSKRSPAIESLESRTLLSATAEWLGGGLTNYITDTTNYVGSLAPGNGDSLQVVSYASQTTIVNNVPPSGGAPGLQLNQVDIETGNTSITGGTNNNPLAISQGISVGLSVQPASNPVANPAASITAPLVIVVGPGGSLTLDGSAAGLTVSGNISGDGGVTTTGLTTLSGNNNSFTGPLNVVSDTTIVAAPGGLPNGVDVTIGSAAPFVGGPPPSGHEKGTSLI